jgi:hypothetical protein
MAVTTRQKSDAFQQAKLNELVETKVLQCGFEKTIRGNAELDEKISRSATSRILLHPKMEKTLFDMKDQTLAVRNTKVRVWNQPGDSKQLTQTATYH